ncbi:nucleoside deaminase [Alkalibacter mobilis]|uniref:nucleoside deaminase n=1 Tax=Alkalibacter mobilis TaxID=2787712 RepID=UPI00189E86C9|nr:nucleoside deaminase [Alkalibacter mobilis]MBF7097646.1 nucleoside deaminase [Alkalibacter mobilis]
MIEYMHEALIEARLAGDEGEVPVGAVIVKNGSIIARGRNSVEKDGDPLGHAEINAIKKAVKITGDWRLEGCSIYVNVEPCTMCIGAIVNSRLKKLVYGVKSPKTGSVEMLRYFDQGRLLNNLQVYEGILEEESKVLMEEFFAKIRS